MAKPQLKFLQSSERFLWNVVLLSWANLQFCDLAYSAHPSQCCTLKWGEWPPQAGQMTCVNIAYGFYVHKAEVYSDTSVLGRFTLGCVALADKVCTVWPPVVKVCFWTSLTIPASYSATSVEGRLDSGSQVLSVMGLPSQTTCVGIPVHVCIP